jgi:hypothetical protein
MTTVKRRDFLVSAADVCLENNKQRYSPLNKKNVPTQLTELSLIGCGDTAIVFSSVDAQVKGLTNCTQIHFVFRPQP